MAEIASIQWGYLNGKRLRHAGCNARLGDHGIDIREPVVKITMDDGSSGFGFGHVTPDQAEALLGVPLSQLVSPESGVAEQARSIDCAVWDLYARRQNQPVYALLNPTVEAPFRAPCYDTSLYFDDLRLDTDADAAALIAGEALQGYERGHRAFKVKVGRGALHMPLEDGTRRDIAVIRAVRDSIGPNCALMIDANNGYNTNLVKRVLAETADCNLYWIEEPFHEDPVLYAHLRDWMDEQGLSVLLADGEGDSAPRLMEWARAGILDVVQYDLRQHGFSRWLEYARQLDGWDAKAAPHNYGSAIGAYVTCHLAAASANVAYAEWDHIELEGLDASGYAVDEGAVRVPDAPGFGLVLDASALTDGFMVGGR